MPMVMSNRIYGKSLLNCADIQDLVPRHGIAHYTNLLFEWKWKRVPKGWLQNFGDRRKKFL
jgi:hypothetical protein